ncbi:class E sortase [Arcanobacterium haemolyticum]|nr:class E sortase [Arcanobacterium haemolyticum]
MAERAAARDSEQQHAIAEQESESKDADIQHDDSENATHISHEAEVVAQTHEQRSSIPGAPIRKSIFDAPVEFDAEQDIAPRPATDGPKRTSVFPTATPQDETPRNSQFRPAFPPLSTAAAAPVATPTPPPTTAGNPTSSLDDLWEEVTSTEEGQLLATSIATYDPETAPVATKRKKRGWGYRITGFVGELMITAGVFLMLFIVWQVWWTDIGANRLQQQEIAGLGWSEPVKTPVTASAGDPPIFTTDGQTGSTIGTIKIPRFGADWQYMVKEGTSLEEVLDRGSFGHYTETQNLGELGNFALAAHRQTYGAPMKHVQDLQIGDSIIMETETAYYVYKVSDSYIVRPDEIDVIAAVPRQPEIAPTERYLTITTCHPPFVSNERWIINAKYDHWVSKSEGMPAELINQATN